MSSLSVALRKGCIAAKSSSLLRGKTHCFRSVTRRNMHKISGSPFTDDVIKYLDDLHKTLVSEALVKGTENTTKVIDFKQPEDLQNILDLEIGKEGISHEKLLEICKTTIKYSVQTAHPLFLNQLYNGRDPYSLAGAWTAEALNTNQHTYEVAPVFILVEKYITEKFSKMVGFADGEGVFNAGGNMANMLGIHMARYNYNKDLKFKGLPSTAPLVLYSSQEAHYSIKTAASFMGFGLDNVEYIKSDDYGKMIPEELESAVKRNLQEGRIPLCVMATCGSTVLGSFDPLNPIADICEKYKLWLHVDGAWGGSVLLSEKHKGLMDGVHRADSVLWNAHKMVSSQIQTSVFVTKHKGLLGECNSSHAAYLYQPDKLYDASWDRGDLSIQCGRKADAYKLWLMWKARGESGMEALVDSYFEKAAYFTQRIKETEGFKLVMPTFENLNISFWYIPPRLRGKQETKEWWEEISKVAPAIKARMQLKGSVMIGYQPIPHKGWVNFWRIVFSNPTTTKEDIDYIIEEIHNLGKDL